MSWQERAGTHGGPLMAVVTWRVREGWESDFEAWSRKIAVDALDSPGLTAINLIPPGGAERECVVILRFDTHEHLHAWQKSEARKEMLKDTESFREGAPSSRVESGLEFWCTPSGSRSLPPRWKMALLTVAGVWPTSLLVQWLLRPLVSGLPSFLRALVVALGLVALLTWVIMPVLSRVFRFWLTGSEASHLQV